MTNPPDSKKALEAKAEFIPTEEVADDDEVEMEPLTTPTPGTQQLTAPDVEAFSVRNPLPPPPAPVEPPAAAAPPPPPKPAPAPAPAPAPTPARKNSPTAVTVLTEETKRRRSFGGVRIGRVLALVAGAGLLALLVSASCNGTGTTDVSQLEAGASHPGFGEPLAGVSEEDDTDQLNAAAAAPAPVSAPERRGTIVVPAPGEDDAKAVPGTKLIEHIDRSRCKKSQFHMKGNQYWTDAACTTVRNVRVPNGWKKGEPIPKQQ